MNPRPLVEENLPIRRKPSPRSVKRMVRRCVGCGKTFTMHRDFRGNLIPLADRCCRCAERMSI